MRCGQDFPLFYPHFSIRFIDGSALRGVARFLLGPRTTLWRFSYCPRLASAVFTLNPHFGEFEADNFSALRRFFFRT